MRTDFQDAEDKKLVRLALAYELAGKRIAWNDLARKMRGKRRPCELEKRLRALKRTYGKVLARFPRCFFPATANQSRAPPAVPQPTAFASQAEKIIQERYRIDPSTEIRQQGSKKAGKKVQSVEYI